MKLIPFDRMPGIAGLAFAARGVIGMSYSAPRMHAPASAAT